MINILFSTKRASERLILTCRALLPRSRYHLFNVIWLQPTFAEADSARRLRRGHEDCEAADGGTAVNRQGLKPVGHGPLPPSSSHIPGKRLRRITMQELRNQCYTVPTSLASKYRDEFYATVPRQNRSWRDTLQGVCPP
ncbi:hypothetical protein BD310DRAFT_164000 [Dichomitus squalens]|uniref:Uncharacterized protein n=1 Tax=Dichomitus squalens TaxID=114155 RepID=A0A4Q9PIG1_9APHY|nr:hypothetical protein BD310DRAFT_164000 [Dichomitus squalens]